MVKFEICSCPQSMSKVPYKPTATTTTPGYHQCSLNINRDSYTYAHNKHTSIYVYHIYI